MTSQSHDRPSAPEGLTAEALTALLDAAGAEVANPRRTRL